MYVYSVAMCDALCGLSWSVCLHAICKSTDFFARQHPFSVKCVLYILIVAVQATGYTLRIPIDVSVKFTLLTFCQRNEAIDSFFFLKD